MKNAHLGRGGRGGSAGNSTANELYRSASPANTLLSRLDRVRETATGCWVARCPAHDDRHPSLSLKECSDGTLLVKCHAECSVADIVAAVGLELRDLFPPTSRHHGKPKSQSERRRYGQAMDALRALARESLVVLVAAENLAAGEPLSAEDLECLRLAEQRIAAAREVAA